MADLVAGVFEESRSRLLNFTNVSQLLLIVSDGRGIYSEGVVRTKEAVRRLVNMGVFTVFVILDNPSGSGQQVMFRFVRISGSKKCVSNWNFFKGIHSGTPDGSAADGQSEETRR